MDQSDEPAEADGREGPEIDPPGPGEPYAVALDVPVPEPELGGRSGETCALLALPERSLGGAALLAENGDQVKRRRTQQQEMLEGERGGGGRLPREGPAALEGGLDGQTRDEHDAARRARHAEPDRRPEEQRHWRVEPRLREAGVGG